MKISERELIAKAEAVSVETGIVHRIDMQYGGYKVVQEIGEHGGTVDLTGYTSKVACYSYLSGVMHGIRIKGARV